MSRPNRIITQLEKQKICNDYINGRSVNQLRKIYKLQKYQIKEILTNAGIKVLSAYEAKQKNALLDEKEYFTDLDKLQCYVLGLIFGDGCVHYDERKYKYAMTITSNDLDILESAKILFRKEFPIKKRKACNAYNFVINSKPLCQELIKKFHLQSPKSNNLVWPTLPEENYNYFVSGLLSTDGCVRIDSRRIGQPCSLEFSYSSNCLPFIENLKKHLSMKLGIPLDGHIKTNNTNRKNTNYSLRYTGANANLILQWIYSNTEELTRCKRKYDIYQNYLADVSNSII